MVRFHRVEITAHSHHAVPGSFGLVVGRVRHAVVQRVGAEVGNLVRGAPVYPEYAVIGAGKAVRASAAADQTVKRVADERDIRDATDEPRLILRRRLARNDHRYVAVGCDAHDARVEATGIGTRRARLQRIAYGIHLRSTGSTFRDIKVPIGTKLKSARVVEVGCN